MDQSANQKASRLLAQLLANTYLVYVKTQNFHWNVVDERFYSLHQMFEKQYEDLAEAIDEIAERMRALRTKVPGSMRSFLEICSLEEADHDLDAQMMIRQLYEDHMAIANQLRPQIHEVQKLGDEGTADLFIQRLKYHEKTAWMLRSHFIEEQ
jgi:starvation-inducible DNA-binding protein